MNKRNRGNRQYSASSTRWLDGLAHFDLVIQHIAGSNLKFTDFLRRNPVQNATVEDRYDEQNVISEQNELNIRYGQMSRNISMGKLNQNFKFKYNSFTEVRKPVFQREIEGTFPKNDHYMTKILFTKQSRPLYVDLTQVLDLFFN